MNRRDLLKLFVVAPILPHISTVPEQKASKILVRDQHGDINQVLTNTLDKYTLLYAKHS